MRHETAPLFEHEEKTEPIILDTTLPHIRERLARPRGAGDRRDFARDRPR